MASNKFSFLLEDCDEILKIISGKKFTSREIDIIACIVNGRTSKKTIAQTLSISPRTVNTHTRNILQKLDCSSWESIREFIEKSNSLLFLRKRYILLLINLRFEQLLQDISVLIRRDPPIYIFPSDEETLPLAFKIDRVLRNMGIITYVQNQDTNPSIETLKNTKSIRLMGQNCVKQMDDFKGINIDCHSYENHYFLTLDVLREILDDQKMESYFQEFTSYSKSLLKGIEEGIPIQEDGEIKKAHSRHYLSFCFLREKEWLIAGSLIIMILFGATYFIYKEKASLNFLSIRSDFVVPLENVLLQRSDIIHTIESKLNNDPGISKIGIVGMGGVGKTTIARLLARSYKGSVVWEVNAETPLSIRNSFSDLGYALAQKKEQKEALNYIKSISDQEEKDKQILSFVKGRLRESPHWLLVFDNIESLPEIEMYLPQDPLTWGEGNVILTTRNINIKDSFYIPTDSIIQLNELTPSEAYFLLTHILYETDSLKSEKEKEAALFLKNISPFPLDVSIAATYIKNSHITFAEYLERMKEQNFHLEQEALLKEVNHDTKTRFGIIALSIENILESNKDFAALLLMISLMDSLDIPKEILEAHSNKFTVNKFMHHLNKYSLITNEFPFENTSTFSIHRSIQEISLEFIKNNLKLNESSHILKDVIKTFETYMSNILDQEDLAKITLLESHAQRIYNNPLLTDSMKGAIGVVLSGLQVHLERDDVKIKPFLEENLERLKKDQKQNTMRIAQALTYLGDNYRSLGDYEKAIISLQQSLDHYEKNNPNSIGFARALLHLGNTYRQKGHYQKAKLYLLQSLDIYKKYFSNFKSRGLGDVFIYLGLLYRDLGDYQKAKDALEEGVNIHRKYSQSPLVTAWPSAYLATVYLELGEYNNAKKLLETTLHIFEKTYGENSLHVAWILAYLGGIYKELGDADKAKNLLEKGRFIYETNKSEIYVYFKVLLNNLGNLYNELGQFKIAEAALEKSLLFLEKHYGKDHLQTAKILNSLGDVYLKEGKLENAEKFMHKALDIYKQHDHTDAHLPLESLSALETQKASDIHKKGNIMEEQAYKNQAVNYLIQALDVVQSQFPENSVHILKIQSKLKAFS